MIVNQDKHIVACGYNSFVAGIDDTALPNVRPFKYNFILHSEINSILACEHRPVNCAIYVTGFPCLHCLQVIAQSGITEIVWDSSKKIAMLEEQKVDLEIMKELLKNKVKIREYLN